MNYLEVKLEVDNSDIDISSFVSSVIAAQKNCVNTSYLYDFNSKRLEELGFIYNESTKGYAIKKDFSVKDLFNITKEISKLKNHIVIHGYLVLKIYDCNLYFWDTALIYEGIDTFEYCLKYHNTFKLDSFFVITKSNTISEDILNLAHYTKRYTEPSLDYITEGYFWDKKENIKVKKSTVLNPLDCIKIK
jgi:hypothetical protein